jgi:hypothetical protein
LVGWPVRLDFNHQPASWTFGEEVNVAPEGSTAFGANGHGWRHLPAFLLEPALDMPLKGYF